MLHILYTMKCLLKTKELIFWSLVFPILLGTMFTFAFGSINEQYQFIKIKVGVLNYDETDHLMAILEGITTDYEENMFVITKFEDEESAKLALAEEKIEAYIDFEDNYSLTVMDSNINTSITKSVLDEYRSNKKMIEQVALRFYSKNDDAGFKKFLDEFEKGVEVTITEIPLKGRDKDVFTQYFFALLAMTCLIASQSGLEFTNKIQPDLSTLGARRNISPMKKKTQVLYDFIANYVIYCIVVTIVVFVCIFGFKRDFGDNLFLVLFASYIGSFTGMTVGTTISVWVKGNLSKKGALCTVFFMVSSFLAGLQWGDIIYFIEKKCPIINRINPGTLIVNSYSSLMVFGDVGEYAKNVITLFVIGILFLFLSILKLRREKYANL